HIQDVTDPANPISLLHINKAYPLPDGIELYATSAVAVQNKRLYVSSLCGPQGWGDGILVFDVTNPVSPVYLDRIKASGFDTDGHASSNLLVEEPYVYHTYTTNSGWKPARPAGGDQRVRPVPAQTR